MAFFSRWHTLPRDTLINFLDFQLWVLDRSYTCRPKGKYLTTVHSRSWHVLQAAQQTETRQFYCCFVKLLELQNKKLSCLRLSWRKLLLAIRDSRLSPSTDDIAVAKITIDWGLKFWCISLKRHNSHLRFSFVSSEHYVRRERRDE